MAQCDMQKGQNMGISGYVTWGKRGKNRNGHSGRSQNGQGRKGEREEKEIYYNYLIE